MGKSRIVCLLACTGLVMTACSGASSTAVGTGQTDTGSHPGTGDATTDPGSDDGSTSGSDDGAASGDTSSGEPSDATVAGDAAVDDARTGTGDAAETDGSATEDAGTFVCGTLRCNVATEYCAISSIHIVPLPVTSATATVTTIPVPTISPTISPPIIIKLDAGTAKDGGIVISDLTHKCLALPSCDSSDECSCIAPSCVCTDNGNGVTNNCAKLTPLP